MPGRSSPVSAFALVLALAVMAASCGGGSDDDGGEARGEDGVEETTTSTVVEARPSAGCGASDQQPVVEEERTLTVDGTDRRYLLTVPGAHDGETPLPLVVDSHGLMEGADIHTEMSQYSALAEDEGFVVVFPHGTGQPVQWDLRLEHNPDLVYFDTVLEELTSGLCIDESRIYATGLSMGAMFTSTLLCTRADVLAAATPVAGLLDPEGCDPSRPVPIRAIHGAADGIVLFNGGFDLSSVEGGAATSRPEADLDGEGIPANVAAWAERNGCQPEPTEEEVDGPDEVIRRAYDCPAGADVEFDIVVEGGHAWPASEFSRSIENVVGYTTFDIDATRDGWEFMSRFANPGRG